jgi:hypothetical protein
MSLLFGRRAQVVYITPTRPSSDPLTLFGGGDAAGGAPGLNGLLAQYAATPPTPLAPAGMQYPKPQTGYRFDGLHVRFKVEKTLLGTPNTMELVVYNLASTTRRQMQDQGGYVRLLAGYQSDFPNLPLVFQGNARTIDHIRKGADWETRIQCGDAETAYRFGFVSKSWGNGTTAAYIASYLAQQVQAADVDPVSHNSRIDISAFLAKVQSIGFPQTAFAFGFAVQGNAFEELQRLLGPSYTLSIQDGELRAYLASDGSPTRYVLSAATGLIGSPEHCTPNLAGAPPLLKLHCLLNPRIRPGDIVNVDSRQYQGNFRVQHVGHYGDLGGNEWFSEIDGTPLAGGNLAAT